MVALLRPQPRSADANMPGRLRLVVDNTDPGPKSGSRSSALARQDRRASADRGFEADSPSVVGIVVMAAIVVFGGLMAVRLVQGSPAEGAQSASQAMVSGSALVDSPLVDSAGVVAAPGDQVVVAQPGDSLWSIAESIAAGNDPRPIVESLIKANGGDSVQIGQQIVIPGQLLD